MLQGMLPIQKLAFLPALCQLVNIDSAICDTLQSAEPYIVLMKHCLPKPRTIL